MEKYRCDYGYVKQRYETFYDRIVDDTEDAFVQKIDSKYRSWGRIFFSSERRPSMWEHINFSIFHDGVVSYCPATVGARENYCASSVFFYVCQSSSFAVRSERELYVQSVVMRFAELVTRRRNNGFYLTNSYLLFGNLI